MNIFFEGKRSTTSSTNTYVDLNTLAAAFTRALHVRVPSPVADPAPVISTPPKAANRFQANLGLLADRVGQLASIPNHQRHQLKPIDLEKLRVNATRGLENKFSLMAVSGSFVDGVELLKENVVATNLIEKVKRHCESYGMDKVFQKVVPPDDGTNVIDPALTKNLFENFSTLTREQILASIGFYREFGQKYDLENLRWSEQFLSNCCDAELSAKLDERMARYDNREKRGGPIYFLEMMEAIPEAATLMKDKLRSLTMQATVIRDVPADITQ